jgi:ubiquinone/menaquinone biosynthesis C-methylase UbiE
MASQDFSYSKFAQNQFYGDLNARLVDMAELGSGQRVIDLACGTGSVTALIAEGLRDAKESVIIAIDQSAVALKQAMENLKDARNSAIQFVQSHVEHISDAVKENVDAVFFCNAIHYIPDKDALLEDISNTLKPGGKFVFNTSFYEGGHPEQTLLFYRKWMFKAVRILRRDYGLSLVKAEKVEARKHLTADQYSELLGNHGLVIVKQKIDIVQVPIDGWLDISDFEDFIIGAMPGVALEPASASLKKGVHETFKEMNLTYVDRNWLDVVAQKA